MKLPYILQIFCIYKIRNAKSPRFYTIKHMINMPQLTNITPEHLRCGIASCPAVYRVDDSTVAIIGKLDDSIAAALKEKVGEGEVVSIISTKFFENVPEAAALVASAQ